MKITKVNNQKLAVERVHMTKGPGYLYENKKRGGNYKNREIKNYVRKRVNESKDLYRPFVQVQKDLKEGNERKIEKRKIVAFQQFFYEEIFDKILLNKDFETNQKIKELYRFTHCYTLLSSAQVELICKETLRQSLKRKGTYQTLIDIAVAITNAETCSDKMAAIGNERLISLIDAVMEDYHKKKAINTIAQSIENQNVKVQVVQNNGNAHLELASAGSEKSKVLFEELKKYSEGEEGQNEVLNHMNRALILYYPECEAVLGEGYRFNISSMLKLQIGSEMNFSEKAQEINTMYWKNGSPLQELRTAFLDEVFSRKRNAVEHTDSDAVKYWIAHIALKLQTKFKKNRAVTNDNNNKLAYMIEMSWKDMLEYLGKKYIDMGKAVYHFAMPEKYDIKNGAKFGEVREEYKQGITSFDYEEIKANETIERKISASIHFAVNQFQSAVSDGTSEILTGEPQYVDDAVHSFLRYFGGASCWKNNNLIVEAEPKEFVVEIRDYFYYLRNRYYHYNSVKNVEINCRHGYVPELFAQEQKLVAKQIKKKYYSNNVPMFYGNNQVEVMLDKLYSKYKSREAQIPSFNKVLKRKELQDFYRRWSKIDMNNAIPSEYRKQYEGMMYFILKEIYYYGFLNDSSPKFYFDGVVERHNNGKCNSQNQKAEKNFIEAVNRIDTGNLGIVCQNIMTQYAMENNRNNLLADRKYKKQKKYDHFPILLYQFMQEAFMDYMNDNEELYGFLKKNPIIKEMPLEEEYLKDWNTNMYQKLFEEVDDNQLAWYLAAHFMPQREVNQLIGSIKNYIQFINDIKTRARYAKIQRFLSHSEGKIAELQKVLEMLDFTLKICLGRFSKEFEDYYWDETGNKDARDIYAEELAQYVVFAEKNEPKAYYVLSNFCKELSDEDTRAVYADGKNPILLRNVELARLFGARKVLPNIVTPVTKTELLNYEELKNKLQPEFDKQEQIKSEQVQKKLCEFQQMKNHVELHDVLKLAELANDLNSYLITLAYIRERDLLYYQLGYYYMKIQFSSGYKKELNCLEGPDCNIEKGAALYQVQAMYTYGMELYDKNGCEVEDRKNKKMLSSQMQTSKKVLLFNEQYTPYIDGTQLFGQEDRMDEATRIRNIIDHSHYYTGFKENKNKDIRSIFDLYSGVYDYFFTYDKKLKKSVPVALENILLKYNVESILEFNSREGKLGNKQVNQTEFKLKTCYNTKTKSEYTLKSAEFTYKVKTGESEKKKEQKKQVAVLSNEFLQQVEKLLYYRQ